VCGGLNHAADWGYPENGNLSMISTNNRPFTILCHVIYPTLRYIFSKAQITGILDVTSADLKMLYF
jgi:hypothetical protein